MLSRESDRLNNVAPRVGISSSMVSQVRPDVGCNIVTYKMNANIMHAIFLEQPEIHKAYQHLVPEKVTYKHINRFQLHEIIKTNYLFCFICLYLYFS
jgi:hypothetical protein